jgi:hypothetical protein
MDIISVVTKNGFQSDVNFRLGYAVIWVGLTWMGIMAFNNVKVMTSNK